MLGGWKKPEDEFRLDGIIVELQRHAVEFRFGEIHFGDGHEECKNKWRAVSFKKLLTDAVVSEKNRRPEPV